jgi:hypothetical protein
VLGGVKYGLKQDDPGGQAERLAGPRALAGLIRRHVAGHLEKAFAAGSAGVGDRIDAGERVVVLQAVL